MIFTIEDAQYIGLRLKAILSFLKKHPHGCTIAHLEREFTIERVGNNLSSILELGIASGLITDDWVGDEQIFKVK